MYQWWQGALIYQIYPRSFYDSNGDGVGDLPGITQKLDYVADLGVDAIWVSPFYPSPMKDFGYDISDYRDVDPLFGCLDDFRELLKRAHSLGLKVIVDQVLSHSSDQHPWFQQSRQDKTNPRADWYVWADPKPDGSAPNNWLSFFGGSAWTFDARREQYYLHNFLTSQPDLNFHNPQVRQAQLDNLKFWLDLGVDGFRLDVVNFYFHDAKLRDNPVLAQGENTTVGVADVNPYSQQRHIHSISQPENIEFLKDIRRLLDRYPGATSMGEINGENALELMASYTSGQDKLHMAYTFDLLGRDCSVGHIKSVIKTLESSMEQGWPCWALGNHDVERVVTRWGRDKDPEDFTRVAMAFLMSLHGSACVYQGEELALSEVEVPYDQIVDPYGKSFWPKYKGRDGCRTPMVWRDQPDGGFSQGPPWLPIAQAHRPRAVARQKEDSDSSLNRVTQFIRWRKTMPALVRGQIQLLDAEEVLCWLRVTEKQTILAAFNLTDQTCRYRPGVSLRQSLQDHGFEGRYENGDIVLPPYQAFFGLVA